MARMYWLILVWVGFSWGSSSSELPATYNITISPGLADVPHNHVCQSMVNIAVEKYFKDKPAIADELLPRIEQLMAQKQFGAKSAAFKKFRRFALNNMDTPSRSSDDPEIDLFMEEILTQALREQLEEKEGHMLQFQAAAQDRVPRRTVAVIAGATSLLCTMITAGVTLAVALNTNC